MYKATIYFDSYEDSYEHGELDRGSNWVETVTADSKEELREKITDLTYSDWDVIEQDNANDYEHATEYWTSYLANDDNIGDASESEIESWRQGKTRLWSVHCHILVSEVHETPVLI